MAARSGRRLRPPILPLLALLLLGASAAEPPPERAVQDARAAIDAGNPNGAIAIIDRALSGLKSQDIEVVYTLRVMRVEAQLAQGKGDAVREIAAEFPPKYRRTKAALRRLMYLGIVGHNRKLLADAVELARHHHPTLLSEVFRARALVTDEEHDASEAIRYAKQHKQRELEAKGNATLGLILTKKQRYPEAAEAYERALALTRIPNVMQNVQGNLGWTYMELGDYEVAQELFTTAEATARRIDNRKDRAVWLLQLGNIRFYKRDYAGADRYNAEAISTDALGPNLGYAWANRARAALELEQYDNARAFNEKAKLAKRDDHEGVRSSDIVDARILMAQVQDYPAAEKLLLNVLANTQQHQLDAQTQLARLYVRRSRPAEARAAFEKAVVLVREARGKITDRELRLAFFNTAAEVLDDYIDFLIDTNRPDEALAVAEASRAESLEEGRFDKSARRLDPNAIARENQATILSYWLGRDRSYLWEITGAGTTLHRLEGDSVIESEVETYRRQLVRQGASLTRRGENLYSMLVAPAKIARGSRVIVVADGQLHTLNFETLIAPNPPRFWVHDVIATSAASLQVLARRKRAVPASPTMLLVGNAPSPDPINFPPLRHAAREMRAIEKRFTRPTVLEGKNATPSAFRAASPGRFDYVHFVAHAVATRTRPLDSSVILASDGKSYKLLARDIDAVPFNAHLVTISSCEGAGTRTYAGEGVVGLAWAFLRAGADQVIASLWKVDDAVSAELMDAMYGEIRRGHDPAVALRNAKLRLFRTSNKPRYWAPFVLYAGT